MYSVRPTATYLFEAFCCVKRSKQERLDDLSMLDSYRNPVPLDIEKSDLPQPAAPASILAESPAIEAPTAGDPSPESPGGAVPMIEEVPILPVRDTVLFPHGLLPISVGRPASVA